MVSTSAEARWRAATPCEVSMSVSIESEETVSIRHHIMEGTLDRIEEQYVLRGVPVGGELVDIPVDDVLRQYKGEDIRIVVVSLEDAERLQALAQGMGNGDGRDDRG